MLKKITILALVLNLVGCSCLPKKAQIKSCPPQKTKITQENINDIWNIPYKTVGAKGSNTTMAELKRQLQNAQQKKGQEAAISALRYQALRETALSIGARGGLAEKASELNGMLLNYESVLSKVFNFNGLILDDNVLPPVLIEARNTINLAGDDAIRIADRNYKLISQAKFVTSSPTWREYIWMAYDMPEMPDRSLLPRNKPESIVWERDLIEGWEAGKRQAELIFKENLARLTRDYNGMILYRKLLSQNMVSLPYVATTDMGVTGDASDMNINDKVLRITAFPELQADSSQWKTELFIHE